MIIVRHHEKCASAPDKRGRLTGTCNCKVAPLDAAALDQLKSLLGKLADDSLAAFEEAEYFALRLDSLAAQIAHDARGVRRTAKRSDKTTAAQKFRAP